MKDSFFIQSTCQLVNSSTCQYLLYLLNDSLESLGIVDCEVSKNLTVDLDTSLVECTHENRVAHTLETCGSVDTLNPQCAEVALLVTTVAICICETLLPCVFGYGPNILAGTIVAAGKFEDSLSFCS